MVIDGWVECAILGILIFDLLISRLQVNLWHKKRKNGKIYYKYTSYLMSILRISVIVSSYLEFCFKNTRINLLISLIGFAFLIIVPIVKSKISKTLGPYWSKHIEIIKGQEVCKHGPYKYLRHPSYSMNVLEIIGICLITNSLYTFIFAFILTIIVYGVRITLEERCLIKLWGDEYVQYKKEVGLVNFKSFIAKIRICIMV